MPSYIYFRKKIIPLKETLSSIKDEESKIARQKERLFELYETEAITKQEFVERKKKGSGPIPSSKKPRASASP